MSCAPHAACGGRSASARQYRQPSSRPGDIGERVPADRERVRPRPRPGRWRETGWRKAASAPNLRGAGASGRARDAVIGVRSGGSEQADGEQRRRAATWAGGRIRVTAGRPAGPRADRIPDGGEFLAGLGLCLERRAPLGRGRRDLSAGRRRAVARRPGVVKPRELRGGRDRDRGVAG